MTGRDERLALEDGTTLNVEGWSGAELEGTSGGAPVLLLNGITMATSSWNLLARQLGGERPVIRYDMRGQGASDAPAGPYRRERHAKDLLALLVALKGRGLTPLHLVALSNGGYVLQLLLAWLAEPRLAEAAGLTEAELADLEGLRGAALSVTLLDTFATVDARLAAVVKGWLAALEYGGPGTRFDVAAPWVWGPEFLAENRAALAEARELAGAHPESAVRALLEGLLASAADEPDLRAALPRLDLPLLVAMGEDDVLTPTRAHHAVLEQFGRSEAELALIPRAGHGAPIENAPAVAALLKPFLSAADAARAASGVDAM